MNTLVLMLCGFVTLGLLRHRLQGYTYVLMGLMILAYVAYAYNHAA